MPLAPDARRSILRRLPRLNATTIIIGILVVIEAVAIGYAVLSGWHARSPQP